MSPRFISELWTRRARLAATLFIAGSFAACGDDSTCETCPPPTPKTTLMMQFDAREGFFDAPFPSDARRDASGKPDIEGFPNPQNIFLVDRVLDVLRDSAGGFALSGGVFFRASAKLDPASLPSLDDSVTKTASVFLIGVDPDAPDYLVEYPVYVEFEPEAGLYGAENLLALVPLQGIALRPNTRYAAVVTTAVKDDKGNALGPSEAMTAIASGTAPAGMSDTVLAEHTAALEALGDFGVDAGAVAALTVFTTDDPTTTMEKAVEAARKVVPTPNEPLTKVDDYDGFCVYGATVDMPDYQAGEPPFLEDGGGFILDETGTPVFQRSETARIFVTVPKSDMPADGYPMVVFSRTGGGGDRPLIDRGVRDANGVAEPGTGPAVDLARVGYGGVSIDGPHGGLRNITNQDEQFLVFNFQNPLALRDNVRQSALELVLAADIVEGLSIDVSDCAGAVAPANTAKFDTNTMAIMGHSMGAAISPLALVYEPRFKAILLSGAGGSFLANMLYKEKPLKVKPLAELILGITVAGYELTQHDPMLTMLQWAGEGADAPIYGRYVIREPKFGGPRNVLMMQGIVDHYIMPPIANATSLSFGLDLAGDEIDDDVEEIADLPHLGDLLPFSGAHAISLPATANTMSLAGEPATAVVTQNPEDGIEDGHEVMFQTDPPKHAYACFLAGLLSGAPRVPSPGARFDPCD
ncbi:MAG: hypothetical protein U0271_13840 [Polyangiaceae bacterium]